MSQDALKDYARWVEQARTARGAFTSRSIQQTMASIAPAVRAHADLAKMSATARRSDVATAFNRIGQGVVEPARVARATNGSVHDLFGRHDRSGRAEAEALVRRADRAMRSAGVSPFTGRAIATGRTLSPARRTALKVAERELRHARAAHMLDISGSVRIGSKLVAISDALARDDIRRQHIARTRLHRTTSTARVERTTGSFAETLRHLAGRPSVQQLNEMFGLGHAGPYRGALDLLARSSSTRSARELMALHGRVRLATLISARASVLDSSVGPRGDLLVPSSRPRLVSDAILTSPVISDNIDVSTMHLVAEAAVELADAETDYDEDTMTAIFAAVMWLHAARAGQQARLGRRHAADSDTNLVVARPGDVARETGLVPVDDAAASRRRAWEDLLWAVRARRDVWPALTVEERLDLVHRHRTLAGAALGATTATITPVLAGADMALSTFALTAWAMPGLLLENYYDTVARLCNRYGCDDVVPLNRRRPG